MAWLAYIIGLVLMMNGIVNGGLIVFTVGVLIHWKFWFVTFIAGIVAFFVGAGWKRPSL